MPFANFHIFVLVSMYFARGDVIEKTSENYGPYTLEMEQIYPCRGPKLVNLTTYAAKLQIDSSSFSAVINMTFLDQTRIDDVKTTVYTMKAGQRILLWNYVVNKPCQHYALSIVFEKYVMAQNCVVKKGTYNNVLNVTEITQNYVGTSFFYGNFYFKVVVLSKKGNVICIVFNPVFKKK